MLRSRDKEQTMVRGHILETLRWLQAGVVRVALIVLVTTAGYALSAQQPPPGGGTSRDMDPLKARGGVASLPSPTWVQKRPIPLDVHFAVQSDLSRTDPPYNKGR